ncbi:MAG: NUDIX domain-containing protein [Bacteroidales bacterium]|nr:MAG: NUDIX domain-containing protein [Bacteroidales bacterium]
MVEDYKVYFQDRYVLFRKDDPEELEQKYGLFHKFHGRDELYRVIRTFEEDLQIPVLVLHYPDTDLLWKEFTGYFKLVDAGGGLIRNMEGEILLLKRRGVWDLPKGKKKKNEKIEDTALREVKEECGIDSVTIGSLLHITYHTYPYKKGTILKRTFWFDMLSSFQGTLTPQKEEGITDIRWISPEKMGIIKGNTFPSISDVIEIGSGMRI